MARGHAWAQLRQQLAEWQKAQAVQANREAEQQERAQRQALLEQAIQALRARYADLHRQVKDQKQLLLQERLIQDLEVHRRKLQPGEACPLCGAHAHPAVEAYAALDVSATEARLLALEAQCEAVTDQGQEQRAALAALQSQTAQAAQQAANGAAALAQGRIDWQAGCAGVAWPADRMEPEALAAEQARTTEALQSAQRHGSALGRARAQGEAARAALQQAEQAETAAVQQRSLAAKDLQASQQQAEALARHHDEQQVRHRQAEEVLAQSLHALGYALPEDGEAWLEARTQEHRAYQDALARHRALHAREESLQQSAQSAGDAAQRWSARLPADASSAAATQLPEAADTASALAQSEAALRVAEQDVAALQGTQVALQRQHADGQAALADAAAAWMQALAQSPFADAAAFHAAWLDDAECTRLRALLEGVRQAVAETHALHTAACAVLADLQAVPLTTRSAVQLDALLNELEAEHTAVAQRRGGIASQLREDTLRREGLQVLLAQIQSHEAASDLWQHLNALVGSADGAKYRKFAQGLTLDHLLDEGFGTLDAETLEIALDALDNLNASGKTIGIISHVEALKDRIPVQIQVRKGMGLGYSVLDARFAVVR